MSSAARTEDVLPTHHAQDADHARSADQDTAITAAARVGPDGSYSNICPSPYKGELLTRHTALAKNANAAPAQPELPLSTPERSLYTGRLLPHLIHRQYDTVKLSYAYDSDVRGAVKPQLAMWKHRARYCRTGNYRIPGYDRLSISAESMREYEYWLTWSGRAHIGVPWANYMPIVVHLHSKYLYEAGLSAAVTGVEAQLSMLIGPPPLHTVSDLHIAADFLNYAPHTDDLALPSRFRTRLSEHIERQDSEGNIRSMYYGVRGEPLVVAIYDKTRHMLAMKESAHLCEIYRDAILHYLVGIGADTDGMSGPWPWPAWMRHRVYRVEARLGRDLLRDLGINQIWDVDAGGLLRYVYGYGTKRGRLQLCDRTPDSNTYRWPIAPEWVAIRDQASALMGTHGVIYERKRRVQPAAMQSDPGPQAPEDDGPDSTDVGTIMESDGGSVEMDYSQSHDLQPSVDAYRSCVEAHILSRRPTVQCDGRWRRSFLWGDKRPRAPP